MKNHERRHEQGFALILALLSLVLLTFLGLTLATSTSTELQVANNFRWDLQALYNAEAGIEAGKAILRSNPNWAALVPTARTLSWTVTCTPVDPAPGVSQTCTLSNTRTPALPAGITSGNDAWGSAIRDFENGPCDLRGSNMGLGVVLRDGPGKNPAAGTQQPMQYMTRLFGEDLNGAVTIWIRRTTGLQNSGSAGEDIYQDTANGTNGQPELVLTAEGTAPFTGSQSANAAVSANRAVRLLEATVSQTATTTSLCSEFGGQTGGSAAGAGYGGCAPVSDAGVSTGLTQAERTGSTRTTVVQGSAGVR